MSDFQNQRQQNNGNNNWQNRQNNNWQNRQQAGGNGGGNGGFQKKPWSGGGGGVRFHNTLMESKLRLAGEKQAGVNYINDFPPSLQVRLYDTNPRIVVKPNIEGEMEEIALRMDPIIAEMFFNTLLTACEEKAGWRNAIVFKNRDQETKKIYDEARAVIGRHSDNGVVYIEISPMTAESRLKVTFNFASRAFTDWVYGDGTKMSPEDLSTRYAKSWAGKMSRLLDVAQMTIPFKKKEWQGNNNNNGQQRNNNWQNRQNNNWQSNQQNNNNQQQAQQRPAYGAEQQQQAPAPQQQQQAPQQQREYIKSNNDFDQYDDIPE